MPFWEGQIVSHKMLLKNTLSYLPENGHLALLAFKAGNLL